MIEIIKASLANADEILEKRGANQPDVTKTVQEILREVKARGDDAVLEYTERFDGAKPKALQVAAEEIESAVAEVGEEFLGVLKRAAANIREYHQKQVRQGFVFAEKPGIVMGQKITPLQKVGVYVPGGTAAYPSTVLMDVIPAQIAGVKEIIMVTPPNKDGKINPAILAAAKVAGVTAIYKVGGAQAIGALCYGTKTIPRVDKIVGPGNIYVATAKQLVYGQVDIDMVAGPSDILIVADETADANTAAADMLGQAEHDVNAAAVLVTTSMALANAVCEALPKRLENLSRREIAEESIKNNGCVIVADDLQQAVDMANALAPEHLELCVEDPFSLLPLVKNAGSIFLGHNTPEALGDYYAGPNHTLPTAGTARFYSPLSVDDFIKKQSYLYYSKEALLKAAPDVVQFANKEGLTAHAQSVEVRTESGGK